MPEIYASHPDYGFARDFKGYGLQLAQDKFTLYAVAKAVEQQPEAVTRCVEEGHDIASHACRWVDHHDWSIEREKAYIRKGITSLKGLTGHAPRGWYYGRPSPHSRSLISQVYQTRLQQALHTPAVNLPGLAIGLSLVAPRYHERHLLAVSQKFGEIFEAEGGWKPRN
ncbi:Chitin deacetylase 1 [Ilyonectria robusta]